MSESCSSKHIHEIIFGERKVQQLTLEEVLARHLVPDGLPVVIVRKNISYGREIGGTRTPLALTSTEIPLSAVAYAVGHEHFETFESTGDDIHNIDDHTSELPICDYYFPVQFYRRGE